MKFLVCTWPKPAVLKTPPAPEAFEAQINWFRDHLASGAIERAYHGDDRAVMVMDQASREDLDRLLDQVPLSEQMERSVEPLIDLFEHTAGVLAYLRRGATRTTG